MTDDANGKAIKDWKQQWSAMLGLMLKEYREGNPNDPRSDREILHSIMSHFVKTGVIKMDENGKYALPEITHDA